MRKLLLLLTCSGTFFLPGILQAQTFTNILVDPNYGDGECTIVISPKNPNNVLASRNADAMYRSNDSGLTWIKTNLSTYSTTNLIGDVALAADDSGHFFCQELDGSLIFHQLRSDDYGMTWGHETTFGDAGWTEDKNWIFSDHVQASPYKGNLYCAWTRRSANSSDNGYLFVNHSADYGQTWVPRDTLDVQPGTLAVPPIGTGLAVGPAGEIGVTWGGGSPNQIRYRQSTDGGNTWGSNSIVVDANVQPAANYYGNINHAISYSAQFTSLARDASGGAYNGNLYCVWDDLRNGPQNADIFLAKSTDGGMTWTTQRINDDLTTRNQVVPTVAVDPVTGWVYVAYLDARTNTDNDDDTLNYYLAWSNNGGQTFTNVRVSNQASTMSSIHSDYMGMDAYGGKVHLLWAGGNGTIALWTASANQSQLISTGPELTKGPELILYPAVPNPSIDFTTFDFEISETANVQMTVVDINGSVVAQPLTGQKMEAGKHEVKLQQGALGLASGIYVATITTPYGQCSRKFVISN